MSLWLLGGHDPTHGAGVYRDLVTARELAPELARHFAVTACTRQGHGRPAEAWPVPAERLRARMRRWSAPRAIKLGLVPDGLVGPIAEIIVGAAGAPIVVDPVLRASDGGCLGASPQGLLPLLRIATLVTPNRPEAHALVGELLEGVELARALARRFPRAAVLLKDGHGSDPARVVDWLVHQGNATALDRPRLAGPDPRGTGCALASAIAARLAEGASLSTAVAEAVTWLDQQRQSCVRGSDGRPHLPDFASSRAR